MQTRSTIICTTAKLAARDSLARIAAMVRRVERLGTEDVQGVSTLQNTGAAQPQSAVIVTDAIVPNPSSEPSKSHLPSFCKVDAPCTSKLDPKTNPDGLFITTNSQTCRPAPIHQEMRDER